MKNENLQKSKDAVRKLIGVALCDFIAYLGSVKDPFIVGGQYPDNRLIKIFQEWLASKKFGIEGVKESTEIWLNMCQTNMFTGPEEIVTPSIPETLPETLPEITPDSLPDPLPDLQVENTLPENGYYHGDEWKPKEEQKKNWVEEGENWKEGSDEPTPA